MSLETEVPEIVFKEMESFLSTNPRFNKNTLIESALINFLFQNGCKDRFIKDQFMKGRMKV
tara:strand:+ start:1662 stop:1844 length:183 start_codon:yes stop_codon:yes gene_type:complete